MCGALVIAFLFILAASSVVQPVRAQDTIQMSPGQSETLSLETCPQIVSGDAGTGMDVQAGVSGSAAGWITPGSIDFGYVAYGDCSQLPFTITVPPGTPTGDYEFDWTYACQLVGAEGTCDNYVASTDVSVQGTAPAAATTTTVACSPNPMNVSTYATCEGSVSGSDSNPPTGSIQFSTDSSTGSFSPLACDVSSGSCSVSYYDTSAGSYTITADYAGDANNSASFGTTGLTVVAPASPTSTTTSVVCTPGSIDTNSTETNCVASVTGNDPSGTVDFSTTSAGGGFNPSQCSLSDGSCSVQYSDSQSGTATITADYSGDSSNEASSGSFDVTVNGGQQQQTSCPSMYLTEGLAPAASTTGDDNVYISLFWGGQIPSGGLSAEFGAFSNEPTITASFLFDPVTMMSSSVSVLMDVSTLHTPDGNYVIAVAAQVTNPQTGKPCSTSINADVTVSGSTVFVSTTGVNQAEDIWIRGLSSPFQVSGEISASQYSNFVPTVGQDGYLSSLAFTLTGQAGTDGTGTLTIPKTLVPPGFTPELLIDGQQVQIRVTEDSSNFYIIYTTHFSTHNVQLQFVQPSSTSSNSTSLSTTSDRSPISTYERVVGVAIGLFIICGIPLIIISLVIRARRKGKTAKRTEAPVIPSTPIPSNHGTPGGIRFCGRCGQPRDLQNTFCTNCGADLR